MATDAELEGNYQAKVLERFRAFEATVLGAALIFDGLTPGEIAALVGYPGANTDEVATDRVEFVLLKAHRSKRRGDLIL